MSIFKRCTCLITTLMFVSSTWAASSGDEGTILDSTLVSSIVALLGVLIGAFVTYWSTKRKHFSDLITKERLDFIKEWRECSARFCELLTIDNLQSSKEVEESPENKVHTCDNSIEYYYYKLILMCNSTKPESYIDQEVIAILELLYNQHQELLKATSSDKEDIKSKLCLAQKQFLALMQATIAIEWHGVTAESRIGILSDDQKEDLRQEHYKNYLEYVKKIKNIRLTI